MPAALEYLPNDRDIRDAAAAELKKRQALYKRNYAYFTGDMRKPLKIEGAFDDNLLIPLNRNAVQDIVNFTAPRFPKIQLDIQANTDDETLVMELWAYDGNPNLLLQQMIYMGAIMGQVYVRIVPALAGEATTLRVLGKDCITFWHNDDLEKVLWHEIYWKVGDKTMRQDVIPTYDDYGNITSWFINEWVLTGGSWEAISDSIEWQYPIAPVICWSHLPALDGFYGRHEFENAHINDQVNYLASMYNRILRFHAYPRTIGIGIEADEILPSEVNGLWTVANTDAKIENLEMMSDLSPIMNQIKWLESHFNRSQQIVTLESDLQGYKNITNLGLQLAFMPMINKSETLRRTYGGAIKDISRAFLMLANRVYERPIVIEWGNPLPVDEAAQTAIVERQVGLQLLSLESAAAKLGLDFTAERDRIREEALDIIANMTRDDLQA